MYIAFQYSLLTSYKILTLYLDSQGRETIVISSDEQSFDLMRASSHIRDVCTRNLTTLAPCEIECAEKVCRVFREFWYQLSNELGSLDCFTSMKYRGTHAKRYITIFSDDNVEWLNFWNGDHPDTMLRPSWYIFNSLERLTEMQKKL